MTEDNIDEEENKDLLCEVNNNEKPKTSRTTAEQKRWVKKQMRGVEIIKNKTQNPKKIHVVYKYSNNGKGELREAVIIEEKSYFLKYCDNNEKEFLVVEPIIEEQTRILRPPHGEEYPYEPYTFSNATEPNQYLERVKNETIDTLYEKIKATFKSFNEVDEKVLNLFSATILATYFQDRFSTVYYIIIVGDNGTGKSAIADTFAALGYRVVVMTNPTKAIWYRVLGNVEYGQVTIIADESEGLEQSSEIMSIIKDGYQKKHKVPRMDNDNERAEWYYPFCFKIIICEKSPLEHKAKGLLDRCFKIKTFKGNPQLDIKEVRNPDRNKSRQKRLDKIEDLRKLLLVFKLYHREPVPELDINIDGRDKELCKPLIQLFYGSNSQNEIEETFQYFLDMKNERKKQSLEAVIFPLLVKAVSEIGTTISSRDLWNLVTENIDGKVDDMNPNLFYSTDYGRVYINTITNMATDKFGAERKHGNKNNSILTFDEEKLVKMDKIYGQAKGIQTKLVDSDAPDAPDAPDAQLMFSKRFNTLDRVQKLESSSTYSEEELGKTNKRFGHDSSQDPTHASTASGASQADHPPDCYYCDEVFNGIGKHMYLTHVIKKHPGKPAYPGMADINLHSLVPKGMHWESTNP
jgi:hypothetical protein